MMQVNDFEVNIQCNKQVAGVSNHRDGKPKRRTSETCAKTALR